MRRLLAAAAVGVAVIAAGVGGWSIGAGTAPAVSSGPLTTASLLTATNQEVGDIFIYAGESRWIYMSVDMGSGNELVTCQVIGADGRVATVGSFRLADGYGAWGSPDPGLGTLRGARLVSASGAVLATATFRA